MMLFFTCLPVDVWQVGYLFTAQCSLVKYMREYGPKRVGGGEREDE